MSKVAHIKESESVAVIEVTGAIAIARVLQSIGTETRARIVGATESNAQGSVTVMLAGGLAEVQHATTHLLTLAGVGDSAFFAKPDLEAMELLLKSLKIGSNEFSTQASPIKRRVRTAAELDITEIHDWNVHELRRFARSLEDFPLKGRTISTANRGELLQLLEASGVIFKRQSAGPFSDRPQIPN